MSRGRKQFVGLAGQYHVAYCLTVRGYHAAITLGNVPDIDLLVSAHDGAKLLAFQVKTATWAHRPKRYGYELREWDVGESAVGRGNDGLWYAFVDLQEEVSDSETTWSPKVYLVPSLWVASMVTADYARKRYFLRYELWTACEERWDRIDGYFSGSQDTVAWMQTNSSS
jgi:hypothetical protein